MCIVGYDEAVERDPLAPEVVIDELDVVVLTQLVAAFVGAEIRRRLGSAGFGDLRESHGYLLQHLLDPHPVSVTELARRLGVTQQAVSKSASELEASGYLERLPVATDGRARTLALTARGRAMIHASRRARADLVDELATVIGVDALEDARRTFARALTVLDPAGTVAARAVQPADAAAPVADPPLPARGRGPRRKATRR